MERKLCYALGGYFLAWFQYASFYMKVYKFWLTALNTNSMVVHVYYIIEQILCNDILLYFIEGLNTHNWGKCCFRCCRFCDLGGP